MSLEALSAEFLSPAEVKDLTGEAKPDAQATELERQGLPHKRRGNRVLVSRWHCREWLAGRSVAPSRGINLTAVR